VPALVEWAIRRLVTGGVAPNSITSVVALQMSTLSSVFVLPLQSIVMALVFLKLRQLEGEDSSDVENNCPKHVL
jgi:hypothetical protein